jgi:hypothetical protein
MRDRVDAGTYSDADVNVKVRRLLELPPELGGSTGGGAVGEVEDWDGVSRTIRIRWQTIRNGVRFHRLINIDRCWYLHSSTQSSLGPL